MIFTLFLLTINSHASLSLEEEINSSMNGPRGLCGEEEVYAFDYNHHCSKEQIEMIQSARKEAVNQLTKAMNSLAGLDKGKFSSELKEAFKKHFKLNLSDPSDGDKISRVKELIQKVARKATNSKFVCGGISNNLFCNITNQPIAAVPPGRGLIHLCSPFFRKNKTIQASTLVHEMFHQHGGGHINYLNEVYCGDAKGLSSGQLVRNPDQFMLFISNLGSSQKPVDCF